MNGRASRLRQNVASRPLHRAARQRGVAVVLFLLVLLTAGAYALLHALNHAARGRASDEAATRRALQEAKRALLGYAVRYPDNPEITNANAGPGLLPCPDTRLDAGDPPGQADPPCAASSSTETGLFPWRTLDTNDVRDSSGAPLWYAVSDNFRNNPGGIVNSTTPGTLRMNDCSAAAAEIVALVIAPGAARPGQNRAVAAASDRYDPANYLEGENASRGDNCFEAPGVAIGNDRVLALTRRELIAAVEGRVLKDVANALNRYYRDPDGDDVTGADLDCSGADPGDCDDAYPWLSPYAEPGTSAYEGLAGTTAGHLPLLRISVAFNAAFRSAWSIPAAGTYTVTVSGPQPPTEACVRASDSCAFTPPGFTGPVFLAGEIAGSGAGDWSSGSCTWQPGRELRCTTQRSVTDPGSGDVLRRTYALALTGFDYTLTPPSAAQQRTQRFELPANGALAADTSLVITLSDSVQPAGGPATLLGTAQLSLAGGAAVETFGLYAVPFGLEVDSDGEIDPAARRSPGELPAWFTANDWQQLVVAAYAAADAAGAPPGDCAATGACLRIDWARPDPLPAVSLNDVRGVVLAADAALATQTRPSADPADYFEGENASLDLRYARQAATAAFNDRLRILDPDE